MSCLWVLKSTIYSWCHYMPHFWLRDWYEMVLRDRYEMVLRDQYEMVPQLCEIGT